MRIRTAVAVLGTLELSACAGWPRARRIECQPPEHTAPSPFARDLVGTYQLTFVATEGERKGHAVTGSLTLHQRDSLDAVVPRIDGTPNPYTREPVWGAATLNLDEVGAYTEGTISSHDPSAPGIAVHESLRPNGVRALALSIGSGRNQRGRLILDGAFIDAPIVDVTPNGFRGRWDASIGTMSYHAAGFFCAELRP